MLSKKAFELFENGTLKKGCKVKMSGLKGFDNFTEIDDAFIKKARPGEMEEGWVVVVIGEQTYDASWIDEVCTYELELRKLEIIRHKGKMVRHFKGDEYLIIDFAQHTETDDILVIYKALYGECKLYARPINMFASEVDTIKYPDIDVKWRMTLIK